MKKLFGGINLSWIKLIIFAILIVIMSIITLINNTVYNTTILLNGGSVGAVFDDSYKVYLEDESFGKVYIVKEKILKIIWLMQNLKKQVKQI